MSSQFNRVERFFAGLLQSAPQIKRLLKTIYSGFCYFVYRKKYRVSCVADLKDISRGGESFFGYYDKSPQSKCGHVLAHLSEAATNALPDANEALTIGLFFSGEFEEPVHLVTTKAFNWQQGSRAHWLDNDLFIFNDFDELWSRYVARVYSLAAGREVKRFDCPVQDSFHTDYFLSLNYQRLAALSPDYGYRNLPALDDEQIAEIDSDGVWKVDYQTGASCLLVSLKAICELESRSEFETARHSANHVMISPEGARFIFLHRYYLGGRRIDRLVLADSDTGELRLIADFGMVSHCCWIDQDQVLGYLRGPDGKAAYWLIDLTSGVFTRCCEGILDKYGDGHPHVVGDWFVTDTYPDKARMQHLLLCNWRTGEVKQLGEFFHGLAYSGEKRCDLHPRLSPDGKTVYIDSVFSGTRHLYAMELTR